LDLLKSLLCNWLIHFWIPYLFSPPDTMPDEAIT
jgi:hypothetical protein